MNVDGSVDFPEPQLPRQYFPLPFSRTGFKLGVFALGVGPLLVQFTHLGDLDKDNFAALEVLVSEREVTLRSRGDVLASEQSPAALLSEETERSFWVSVRCQEPADERPCLFEVGSVLAGADGGAAIVGTSIPNPWYNPRSVGNKPLRTIVYNVLINFSI